MYNEEKEEARKFLEKHKNYGIVQNTLATIKNKNLLHNDRWSIVYDMIDEAFPQYIRTKVVTGIVYLVEEGEI
jgi:hypothetical protein